MYTFLADENLAALDYYFSSYGRILTKPGSKIEPHDLCGVDALLVRSVTKVNADLFRYHQPKFIGSATIGTDHIVLNELASQYSTIVNAPGCNANAVAEYVLCALFALQETKHLDLEKLTFAILGMGHVGQRLTYLLTVLGIKTIAYDPLLTDQSGLVSSLMDLCDADIISLHVPLTDHGLYPTKNIINANFLQALKPGAILINTSRGGVIDSSELIAIKNNRDISYIFDVWPNEPLIDNALLRNTDMSTPHIAGYSYEGKLRGTYQLYQAWLKHIKEPQKKIKPLNIDKEAQPVRRLNLHYQEGIYQAIAQLLTQVYDIWQDDKNIKKLKSNDNCINFEGLRKNYTLRREFDAYTVNVLGKNTKCINSIVRKLGFNVID